MKSDGDPVRARYRILLVDDEPEALVTLEAILGATWEVRTAAGAREAKGLLDRERFDMVIADERMPLQRGTDLLRCIRERHPETIRIVLSAFEDPAAMLRAINEGEVLRFLLKPCDPGLLRLEIAGAFERLELERENGRLARELEQRVRDLEGALRDLADTRSRLAQSEKLALAGKLAAGFAHDVRNYMMSLLGATEVARLQGQASAGRVKPIVDEAIEGVRELAQELMLVAKGAPPVYTLARHDLTEVVRGLIEPVVTAGGHRGRTVLPDLKGPVWCMLAKRKIGRLLWNLLQNAEQFSPAGTPVAIRVYGRDGWGVLEVEDRGAGVAPEIRDRIFEPFFTTRTDGTGLGLQVCRIIAEGHGGRIELDPDETAGTVFRLRLPLAAGS